MKPGRTVGVLVVAVCASASHGQTAKPSFAMVAANASTYTQSSGPSVLDRVITLHVRNVSIDTALGAIASAAEVTISFSDRFTETTHRRVSIDTSAVTVGVALQIVLQNTNLHVRLSSANELVVTRLQVGDKPASVDPPSGSIAGRITDALTHEPLGLAVVRLTPGGQSSTSDLGGHYHIAHVRIGRYAMAVRRLGYLAIQRQVAVADSGTEVHMDLELSPAAATLDKVVSTATGDQSLVALGSTIGTLGADSILSNAPVTTLADLIGARVPGVQIFNTGLTGLAPLTNIRGQNSFTLADEPLLVVDGVRMSNTVAGFGDFGFINNFTGGRFNDLLPEDIESIEIVKGPTAATLYGTDAANGVIVVRTKKGAPGRQRWTAYGETGLITLNRDLFEPSYYGWGHTPTGTSQDCLLTQVAARACVQDSITSFTPLRDPVTSPIQTGDRNEGGLQLTGGSESTRYFLSGSYQAENGYLSMPAADRSVLAPTVGAQGFTGDELDPNALQKLTTRATLTTTLAPQLDLSASGSLLTQASRNPANSWSFYGGVGPGYRNPLTDGWPASSARAGNTFLIRNDDNTLHATGGVTSTWHPTGWLNARATLGIDYSSDYLNQLDPVGSQSSSDIGSRNNEKTNTALYSVDMGATVSRPITAWFTSRTSTGVQYNRSDIEENAASALGLLIGSQTVAGAQYNVSSENTIETVVAGAYGEEAMEFADQLFVTGAFRVDGSSSFGTDFKTAVYPKASISWLVSRLPAFSNVDFVSSLRLRAAYGQAGVQPPPTALLAVASTVTAFADGSAAPGAVLGNVANPQLKPEIQHEYETGADLELLRGRVTISGTYYNKRSTNAIVNTTVPTSIGAESETVNVGSVLNWGYEASISIRPVDSRVFSFDVNAAGSVNHNQLRSLGTQLQSQRVDPTGSNTSIAVGYPLYSYFVEPIHYADRNHNGIIEPNEVTVTPDTQYAGPSFPPTQVTTAVVFGFLNRQLRLTAQVDYRGGFVTYDNTALTQCFFDLCRAEVDPHASLHDQAAAQALFANPLTLAGFFHNGSFYRLREVAITYAIPNAWAHRLHVASMTWTLSGRNLAFWANQRLVDPEETTEPGSQNAAYNPVGNGVLPPPTYWLLRTSIGF